MKSSLTIVFALSLIIHPHLARSEDSHKRAPSGFTGVRGKKSVTDSGAPKATDDEPDDFGGGGIDNGGSPQRPPSGEEFRYSAGLGSDFSKRAPSMGFVGMRGKKPWEWQSAYFGPENDRMPKRAPNGFFGMRGKKNDDMDFTYDLDKRMSSGFFGMRGKKSEDDPLDSYLTDKRAPSQGFVGMRGRKALYDAQTQLTSDFDKRAPSGFFGMRGKKHWSQFGLRGKKIPYQFRGKFVGVRGKKTMYTNDNDDDEDYQGHVETEEANYESEMDRLLRQLLKSDNKAAQNALVGDDV